MDATQAADTIRAGGRSVRATANVVACSTVVDVVLKVYLTTIGRITITIREPCLADRLTNTALTACSRVDRRTYLATTTTVLRVVSGVDLTSVGRVTIAICTPSVAFCLASTTVANPRTTIVATRFVTNTTVVRVVGKALFTAIPTETIAVPEPTVADDPALGGHAGWDSIDRWANLATTTAVVDIARGIDLTTIRK